MLNHKDIGKNLERITKIKPFINKYKCQGIKLPPEKRWLRKNWEKWCNNCS